MATIQEWGTPKSPAGTISIHSKTGFMDNQASEEYGNLQYGNRRNDNTSLSTIVENYVLPEDAMLLMYRCVKTACHEICHVLGMTHCPYYECLMNGSNLVTEADIKPFALCPICLRKLASYF